MADYWKSQARKYCDFCKCWISDNKPSVQFHESGKRHKANVETRIKEIGRKSIADQKAKLKMEDDIKKMEEAATKAYARDLEQNPDLSSRLEGRVTEHKITGTTAFAEVKKTRWHEARSPEGDVYYWHSVTGESKWEVPVEGFISMKDQSTKTAAAACAPKKETHKPAKRKSDKHDKSGTKSKFHKNKKKVKTDLPIALTPSPSIVGPALAANPYGVWETVRNETPEIIDLQLPTANHKPLKLSQQPLDDEHDTKIEFTEKSVLSITDSTNNIDSSNSKLTFKKPKVNRNNTRYRTVDM